MDKNKCPKKNFSKNCLKNAYIIHFGLFYIIVYYLYFLFIYVVLDEDEKSSLSIVVLTQNIRCNIIPKIKSIIHVIINGVLYIYDIMYPTNIVIITSTIAILNIRYE